MMDRHALISAMLKELPEPGFWPKEGRQKWLVAFGAVLDLVYPTTAPAAASVPTPTGPLTANQQYVLESLQALCSGRGEEFTQASLQKIAQESGVALGSLPSIMEKLVSLELVERRTNSETKIMEYRVVRKHD